MIDVARILGAVLFWLLTYQAVGEPLSHEIIYADYLGYGADITIEPHYKGGVIFTGDAGEPLLPCDGSEDLMAICSMRLTFAAPYTISRDSKDWTLKGSRYELKRVLSNSKLFGRAESVFVIERVGTDFSTTFFYSRERGLLGFRELGVSPEKDKVEHLYLLQGNYGVGALK